jgi:hypothetical protein
MPHTYTFIPDIGDDLVAPRRTRRRARAHLAPSQPQTRTARDVVALVYQAAGTNPTVEGHAGWSARCPCG